MKIVDLRATPVTVPAEAPWRWSMGIETGTTRTIVELDHRRGDRRARRDLRRRSDDRGARDRQAVHRRARPARDRAPPASPRRVLHRLRDERAAARPGGHRDGLPGRRREGPRPVGRVAARWRGPRRGRRGQLPVLPLRVEDGRLPAVDTAEAILDRAERARRAQRPPRPQAQGRRPRPRSRNTAPCELLRDRFPDDPLVWDPNAAWSVETTIRDRSPADGRRLRAAMARGSVQLAGGDEPGSCRDRHPVRDEHVPDRAGPARAGHPGAERRRDPGRRPLLGRVPGQPEDGGGGRSVQPRPGHAQRPRARDLHRRDGPPGLCDPEPDLRHRQPLSRPGRRHRHEAVGLSRRPVRPPDRARASGSSSIATSSTSTIAISSTTPRSTSSTTRTGRTGCPRSRSSECRIAR